MGEDLPPLRAISYADLTPQKAREVVARISPAMRGKLAERVHQALQFHQQNRQSEAARFCMLMLDALRNSSVDDSPSGG